MSKIRTSDFKSKSLQKNTPKDMYFPVIDLKGIANFPFSNFSR